MSDRVQYNAVTQKSVTAKKLMVIKMMIKMIKYEGEKAAEAGFFSDSDSRIRAVITYESDDGSASFKFEAGESLAAGAARFKRQVAFDNWFEENIFSSYSDIGVAAPIDDNGDKFTVVDDFVSNGKSCMPPAAYNAALEALKDHAVSMVSLEFQFSAGIPEELITALQNKKADSSESANEFSEQMLTELKSFGFEVETDNIIEVLDGFRHHLKEMYAEVLTSAYIKSYPKIRVAAGLIESSDLHEVMEGAQLLAQHVQEENELWEMVELEEMTGGA